MSDMKPIKGLAVWKCESCVTTIDLNQIIKSHSPGGMPILLFADLMILIGKYHKDCNSIDSTPELLSDKEILKDLKKRHPLLDISVLRKPK